MWQCPLWYTSYWPYMSLVALMSRTFFNFKDNFKFKKDNFAKNNHKLLCKRCRKRSPWSWRWNLWFLKKFKKNSTSTFLNIDLLDFRQDAILSNCIPNVPTKQMLPCWLLKSPMKHWLDELTAHVDWHEPVMLVINVILFTVWLTMAFLKFEKKTK